jgi:protein-tyrosine phosphatase
MSRRKSIGNVAFSGTALDDIPHNSDIIVANEDLDSTARLAMRRKSSKGVINLSGLSQNLIAAEPGEGFAGNDESQPLQRNNSYGARFDASIGATGDRQTPRRRGSNSGLADPIAPPTLSRSGSKQRLSFDPDSADSLTRSTSGSGAAQLPASARRLSIGGSIKISDSGTNSQPQLTRASSTGETAAKSARGGSGTGTGTDTPPSLSRRSSFSNAASNPGGSRRPSLSGDVSSSQLGPMQELKLVQDAQASMKAHPGRSVASVRKKPSYGTRNASSKRGVTILTENICLGGRDDASDLGTLQKLGITHVLNMAAQLPNFQEDRLVCMKIPVKDEEDTQITDVLPLASKFISRVEAMNGRVLVHCISGVSRSTTIVIMYLMQKHGMPLRDAYDYVYSCRPWIGPNDGFKLQMADLELHLFGASSVATQNSGPAWNFYAWNSRKASVPHMSQSDRDRANGNDGGCIVSLFNCFYS